MNSLTDTQIDDLLSRYMADELSALEHEVVQEYLSANPGDALLVKKVKSIQPIAGLETEPRVEDIKGLIAGKLGGSLFGVGSYQLKNWDRWLGSVGALSLALLIAFVGFKYLPLQSTPQKKTYTTAPAQRARITLGDGSTVTLAPATVLRVTDNRIVEIVGEAIFTVTSHKNSPFTVTANGVTTRVLGTTFSVRKYNEDRLVRVVVAEGKVAFGGVIVSTGDVATTQAGRDVQVAHDMPLAFMLDWASGKLAFNRTSLQDAIPDLQRWYGVEIHVADKELLQRRVTASFQNENIQQVAHALEVALGAKATVKGNILTFSKGEI